VRAWVVIAVACIGGTATARDMRRDKKGRGATGGAPALANPPPTAPRTPKRSLDTDSDPCWCLDCCGSSARSNGRTEPVTAVDISTTPLTGAEVVDGFRVVEATVQGCRPVNARPDPISIRVAISKAGQVSAVTVRSQPPLTTAVSCIENALKGAHFRASPGLSADYVFLFKRFAAEERHAPPDGGVDAR
jgi:hypothetical protein